MCGPRISSIIAGSAWRPIVSLHFPLAYSLDDFTETLRAFDKGTVRPGHMISETIGLHALPAMIEEMRGPHSHLKVQVAPNQV